MKAYCGGKIVMPGKTLDGHDILTQNGKIVDIVPAGSVEADERVEVGGCYIAPGFIDIHCHGGGDAEFIDGTPEAYKTACAVHASHGTRVIFPTISATDEPTMARALAAARAAQNNCACIIGGVHLEGPYLSREMAGGQAGEFVKKPLRDEYTRLTDEYGDIISRWTYAPEHDDGGEFLHHLTSHGIVPSTGHSAAEYSHLVPAFEGGNRLVTHLYSCTSTVTRHCGFRHPGIIETAFLLDEMDVEVIADGRHLPPELLKMIIKIKGIEHTAMITDSLRPAGAAKEGQIFDDCAVPFVIEDNVAKLLDRSAFAGSVATTDLLLKTAVSAGFTVNEAVTMLTATPARIMHLDTLGAIEPGRDAVFTVFDGDLNVKNIM